MFTFIIAFAKNAIQNIKSGVFENKPNFGLFWGRFIERLFFTFWTFVSLHFWPFFTFFRQIIKNFLTSIIALAKNAIRNIESGVFEDKPNLHRVELVDNEINHLKLSALSVGRVSPKGTVFCGFVLTSVSLLHIVSFSRIYLFFKIRYWSFLFNCVLH